MADDACGDLAVALGPTAAPNPRLTIRPVNPSARRSHPWLRVQHLLCDMLGTSWDGDAWPTIKAGSRTRRRSEGGSDRATVTRLVCSCERRYLGGQATDRSDR